MFVNTLLGSYFPHYIYAELIHVEGLLMYSLDPFVMAGDIMHSNQGSTFSNYTFYCLISCHMSPAPTYQLAQFTSLCAQSHL